MRQANNIQIFDTDELAKAAAELIVEIVNKAIDARGRCVICLSGGHTPEALYTELCTDPYQGRIAWAKLFFFWGDERCVPSDDAENNARMAKIFLLDNVDTPKSNIYPIPVDMPAREAAAAYENTIRVFFGSQPPCFDIILLGLGENGHTASLFPGTDVVAEHDRLIKEAYVKDQKIFRITMTANLINQASNILFLVTGDGKAEILNTVLNMPYQPDRYPAQLIKPIDGNLYWFVDNKAAHLLSK